MRYHIDFGKVINRLTPHYLGGRQFLAFMTAIIKPLQDTNEAFVAWAKECKIEASMTSQVLYFEWYLNRKFRSYFVDPTASITIINSAKTTGTPIFNQGSEMEGREDFKVFGEGEPQADLTSKLYHEHENVEYLSHSFTIVSPQIKDGDTPASKDVYEGLIRYIVDKYKLAGKTYEIIYQ